VPDIILSKQEEMWARVLSGARVTEVLTDPNSYPESGICLIEGSNGQIWRLCSTEIGWWLELMP
jgi:hypothetical protein